MGELVSVASQAPVTTCVFVAATVAADSFLRSLQASLQHFPSLKPSAILISLATSSSFHCRSLFQQTISGLGWRDLISYPSRRLPSSSDLRHSSSGLCNSSSSRRRSASTLCRSSSLALRTASCSASLRCSSSAALRSALSAALCAFRLRLKITLQAITMVATATTKIRIDNVFMESIKGYDRGSVSIRREKTETEVNKAMAQFCGQSDSVRLDTMQAGSFQIRQGSTELIKRNKRES